MEANAVPVKQCLAAVNPCCTLWKEKCSKLEAGRKHLRQAVQILTEQFDKVKAEKDALQEAYEDEKARARSEKVENEKVLAARVALENEISVLKSELNSLRLKGDDKKEVEQENVSKAEKEIVHLKALLEKEKMRSDSEKKSSEAQKKSASEAWKLMKAEKSKAEEERKLAYSEGKKAEDYRLQSEGLRKEMVELKSKLDSETLKFAEVGKKLEAEKHKAAKERKRADSEMAKAEGQRKLAEANGKKFMEEKSHADNLSQQLEDARRKNEELRKDIYDLKSSRNLDFRFQCDQKEISALNSEISLQRNESSDIEGKTREVKHFHDCISEGEKQISRLKVLLEKEKEKADQMKTNVVKGRKSAAEAWKCVKAEKDKADEEKMNADIERKKAEHYQIQLEALRKEANETKVRLASEILQLQKEIKELEREKQHKSKEATKRFEGINKKRITEREYTDIGSVEVEEQRELAEVNKMALEEKSRADQLSFQLEESRLKIDELQKQIQELLSRKAFEASVRDAKSGTRNLKSLEKHLKLEKMRLKYAKQVRKLEMNCNNILKNELSLIKMDSLQLSRRLGALDKWFTSHVKCREDLEEAANMQRSKLKRDHDLGTFPSCAKTESDLLKSTCSAIATSDPARRILHCSAPLFPVSEGNCTAFISGIHPKLRSLDGGSSEKLLQSSAMNSSSASFSDDQLTGSQERGAFVSTTSEKQVEENNGKTICCISGEVTKTQCNENLAVVAENSVRSPNSVDTFKEVNRRGKHSSVLHAIESVETLYSEGKKLHLQMEEKLSPLHGMLKRKLDKPVEESKYVEASLLGGLYAKHEGGHKKRKVACSDESMGLEHLCRIDEQEKTTQTRNDVHAEANASQLASSPAIDLLGIPWDCIKGLNESFGSDHGIVESIDGIENGDYMKLLDLDNTTDEECYRRAMEMPLSPTLPEIDVSSSEILDVDKLKAINNLCGGLSNEKEVVIPFHSLDVIDVEISSDNLEYKVSGTPCNEVLHGNEGLDDGFDVLRNGSGDCNTMVPKGASDRQTKDTEVIEMSQTHGYSKEQIKFSIISSESKHGLTCDNFPSYCVVLSNTIDSRSVSRIFSATRTCMVRFLSDTEGECMVQKILHALKMEDKILPMEKACVLFTLLLLNFSWLTSVKSGSFMDKSVFFRLDSFASQINAVLSNAEPRSLFAELCCWDELVGVTEDFLVNGQLMVPADVSSETLSGNNSSMRIFLDGVFINLSSKPASAGLLVAGSIILASVCTAIDHIEFICEASYNLLLIRKYDNDTLLTILHVFAYLGGKRFLYLKEHSLTMTVLRFIVVLLEGEQSSVSAASCLSPFGGVTNKFQPCAQCPFDSVSVDFVLSLLWEKLYTGAPLVIMHRHLMELDDLSNTHVLCRKDNAEQRSCHEQIFCSLDKNCDASCGLKNSIMSCTHLNSVGSATLFDLTDVLSLVELVACYMSWGWTCGKVIPVLLEILERPMLDDFAVAVVLLLGQLGRLGIAACGCDDKEVESLKSKLSGLLWSNAAIRTSLPVQIAIVTSLLGLLRLNFNEVVESDSKLPEVVRQSVHVDAIRKWFSMLSKEQRTLSHALLQST